MGDVPLGPGFPNPFGFDLDELMRMLQSQGPVNLDIARGNVDLAARISRSWSERTAVRAPS